MNQNGNIISADDLRPIFKFLSKNWLILLLFPLIGFGLAYLYTQRQAKIYAAKTEILLKSEETYNYQNELRSNFGYFSQYADIENQKRILKSYDMIDNTLKKLNLNVAYYIQGRLRKEQTTNFPAFEVKVDYKTMSGSALNLPITFKLISAEEIEVSYSLNGDDYFYTQKLGVPLSAKDPHLGDLTISASSQLSPASVSQFSESTYVITVSSDNKLVSDFRSVLNIQNVEFTSILSLTVNNEVPAYAKMFLDTLSSEYVKYSLEKQYRVNQNTQVYIDKQLAELETIIDSLGFSSQVYKNQKNIIDLDKEQDFLFKELLLKEQERSELEQIKNSFEELTEFVKSDNNTGELPPSFYIYGEDELLKKQVVELYESRQERVELLDNFTEATRSVIKKDSLIKIQASHILTYLENSKTAISKDISAMNAQIRRMNSKLLNLPKSQRTLLEIERKLKVNESLYVYLLESRASTVIAKAAILPEISVIENARSIGMIGPNNTKTIYSFVGAFFLLAAIIGFLRVTLLDRIESLGELKSITKLPVLGSIPNYLQINEQPISILENSRSNVAESFRALRTNLQYVMNSKETKTLLVSSLHPSEGKTFASTNLSSVISKAGKKTILLDFDLHKPKVHKTLQLANTKGISSILANRKELEDCIIPSGIENLDVITAGPIPPNASELILSKRTEELINSLKQQYEYVIIDTPPLMLISDSLVLHTLVDNSIFILNTEKAQRAGIRFLEETLEQNNISNVSLILNNVRLKKLQRLYAKYGNKYSYGYGYNSGGYVHSEE
ncbi:MAG: polysaccharide biosynthesis tyrosine autokinase [Flavobacteriales bacterium]